MSDLPWFKFYPKDWRGNEHLGPCTLEARGLWVEMMCIMHEAVPYGYLTINKIPVTTEILSRLVRATPEHTESLLQELEMFGVFSRTGKGVIYSRRMVKDSKKAQINRKNGVLGGAAKHKKTNNNSGLGKPEPSDTSSLEVRDQSLDIDKKENRVKETLPLLEEVEKKNKPKKTATTGHRIPEDWNPGQAGAEYARIKGFSDEQILNLHEEFVDYWLAEAGPKSKKMDWNSAWKNWVRRDIKWYGAPGMRAGGKKNLNQIAG